VIVRPATPADAATLHILLCELAAFEGGTVTATIADLEQACGRGSFEALLAEADGAVQGLLTFFPTYSSWRGRPALMIHDLYVRGAARGKGAGKALVAELKRLAAQRGCCRVEVNVLDWNAPARAFYERMGLTQNDGWLGYRGEV
jgi:GNAT superfamily N-acetyltransferase